MPEAFVMAKRNKPVRNDETKPYENTKWKQTVKQAVCLSQGMFELFPWNLCGRICPQIHVRCHPYLKIQKPEIRPCSQAMPYPVPPRSNSLTSQQEKSRKGFCVLPLIIGSRGFSQNVWKIISLALILIPLHHDNREV